MKALQGKVIIVTGASSGFGAAVVDRVAVAGADVAIGARRFDRLEKLKTEVEITHGVHVWAQKLDVRKRDDANDFVEGVLKTFGRVDALVNNAGLALGRSPLAEADEADWQTMFDTNVMGAFRMAQLVLADMLKRGEGQIVNIGSIAGRHVYEGAAGYCGSKFAIAAMTQTLRQELCGKGIKISTVDPGAAETEFSLVRFKGDQHQADAVYQGMKPLTADDVADAVLFVLTRPSHVNIDDVVLTPLAQGSVTKIHRVE